MILLLVASVALLAYVFAGYPALLAVLARLRPKPLATAVAHEPMVSLVIVAYNEADVIEAKLRNVDELDYPRDRLEVIVAADGSDDDTVARAQGVPGIRVLHEPARRGKLAAMQRAAEAAAGEILVFSDANNAYTPQTLRAVVAPFADPAVGVVTGRKAIDDGHGRPLDKAESLYWRYEAKIKAWESATGSVVGVAGEILAFRREAFVPTSGRWLTEDFVQSALAVMDGWRVVYAAEAISLEHASATIDDEAVRRSRLVTGRLQAMGHVLPRLASRRPWFAWQVFSHKALRPAVPWLMLTAAGSNLAGVRRRRWTWITLALQVAFYGAAAAGWRNEARGRRSTPLYVAYYFCRMNLASIGGLANFVRRRYGASWTKVPRR